jgi:hypothetical protein
MPDFASVMSITSCPSPPAFTGEEMGSLRYTPFQPQEFVAGGFEFLKLFIGLTVFGQAFS